MSLACYVITLNEAQHIERCLRSLFMVSPHVLVVDSGSTDGTQDIARAMGAVVEEHPFTDFANQRNYALERLAVHFDANHVFTLDGDEYIEPEEAPRISAIASEGAADVGMLPVRVIFLGRPLLHGNRGRLVLPRLFRSAYRYEPREVNEHVSIPATAMIVHVSATIIHDDGDSWTELVSKHERYAQREAEIRASRDHTPFTRPPKQRHLRNRWLREHVYERTPGKVPLSFVYQYLLRLGFLDGRAGLDRALLDAFTEFLIDRKAREIAHTRAATGNGLETSERSTNVRHHSSMRASARRG